MNKLYIRAVTLALIVLIVCSLAPLFSFAAATSFSDNFESSAVGAQASANWTLGAGGLTVNVQPDPTNSKNKALCFSAEGAAEKSQYWIENKTLLDLTDTDVTVEFSLYFPKALAGDDVFYVQFFTGLCTVTSGDNRNDLPWQFFMVRGDSIVQPDGKNLGNYPVGEWFTMRYALKNGDGVYDVYMKNKGAEKKIAAGFVPPANWQAQFAVNGLKKARICYIYGGNATKVYLDNVSQYAGDSGSDGAAWNVPQSLHGKAYEKSASLLNLLNIYTQKEVNIDNTVSRAQMATVAYKAMGLHALNADSTGFGDVPEGHQYAEGVYAAEALGIISKGNLFHPDDAVTLLDATAMLLRAVGRFDLAVARGGYPSGYLFVATDLNLWKNLNTRGSLDVIKVGDMLELVLNALRVPYLSEIMRGENVQLATEARTFLEARFKTQSFSGVLGAVDEDTFGVSAGDGKIRINSSVIKNIYPYAAELLGYTVECWYRADDLENDTVIFLAPYNNQNTEITLREKDIENVSASKITYSQNDKLRDVSLNNPAVLYNGRPSEFNADLIAAADRIKLICNNGLSSYNVIIAEKFTSFVVGAVSVNYEKINDRDGNYNLDLADKEYVGYIKDGKKATIKDVKAGLAVSVATERLPLYSTLDSARYFHIYVSTKKVSGEIEEIDNSEKRLKIGGVWYDYENGLDVKIGDTGDWLIDVRDFIIGAANRSAGSGNYGILLGTRKNNGLQSGGQLKIFTSENRAEVFDFADKLRVDDENKTSDDAFLILNTLISKDLIKYDIGMYGELLGVYTPVKSTADVVSGFYIGYNEKSFSKDYEGTGFVYGGSIITPSHRWNSATLVFEGPEDGGEDDYNVTASAAFGDGGQTMRVYDVNANGLASAVFIIRPKAEGAVVTDAISRKHAAIITSVGYGLDVNGENVRMIKVFENGVEVKLLIDENGKEVRALGTKWSGQLSYTPSPRNSIADFKPGDLVQYSVDSRGKVSVLHLLYNSDIPFETAKGYIADNTAPAGQEYISVLATWFGEVQKIDGVLLNCSADPNRAFTVDDSAKVYVFEASQRRARAASRSDISPGDRIFIKTHRNHVDDVIIYK